jgi:hypothetical protein
MKEAGSKTSSLVTRAGYKWWARRDFHKAIKEYQSLSKKNGSLQKLSSEE